MACGLTNMDINQLIFWGMFGVTVEIFFTAITELITKKNLILIIINTLTFINGAGSERICFYISNFISIYTT